MATPVNVINGYNGSERVVTGTALRTGTFGAIYCNADTEFSVLTGSYAGTVTGITHEKGKWIYGVFTAVDLTSGDIDLYNL
jgi:hypothetical protein